jgi:hypothetical protein
MEYNFLILRVVDISWGYCHNVKIPTWAGVLVIQQVRYHGIPNVSTLAGVVVMM